MESRILELLHNQELLQQQDLPIIQQELSRMPYAQSLRALYLVGIHQFDNSRYSDVLAETAAYTTDKKILYHLINKSHSEQEAWSNPEVPIVEKSAKQDDILDESTVDQTPQIVDPEEGVPETEDVFPVNEYTEEKIIHEEQLPEIKEEIENSELSFHGISDFLPKVDFKPANENYVHKSDVESKRLKHEEEMRRLIAEVEAKMKAKKKETNPEPEEEVDVVDINFARIDSFEVENKPGDKVESSIKPQESRAEIELVDENRLEEKSPVTPVFTIPQYHGTSSWQPIPIPREKPDATIQKAEITQKSTVTRVDKTSTLEAVDSTDSNVPQFVNTWKNWLKINQQRNAETETREPVPVQHETPLKDKVIEAFIENTPKISRFKKESNFEIKERDSDISHLMTETLAKLYTQQKNYPRAIKAYKVLIEKHPDRAEEFQARIEEIKKLRSQS